jgi:hypothetical protein
LDGERHGRARPRSTPCFPGCVFIDQFGTVRVLRVSCLYFMDNTVLSV